MKTRPRSFPKSIQLLEIVFFISESRVEPSYQSRSGEVR